MSLDVYLDCECCGTTLFSANVTHNLGQMAREAGIYLACWRPEELKISSAVELAPLLDSGLELLKSAPDRFRKFNPENGWGNYEGLVEFVERYAQACKSTPRLRVRVWR